MLLVYLAAYNLRTFHGSCARRCASTGVSEVKYVNGDRVGIVQLAPADVLVYAASY